MSAFNKQQIPAAESALKGRESVMPVAEQHYVNGHPLKEPFTEYLETIYLGLGCFWGAERLYWNKAGVWTTAVGYAGGSTLNPTYEEVCSGGTGHTEIVLVVFDPVAVSLEDILKLFWESHDPTQGMRQGNDIGTQYRSAIYGTSEKQLLAAEASRAEYQQALSRGGRGEITTEIKAAPEFYYAEDYHQQYLAKNPGGYCGIGGTGICLPPN
ncbi:MAG: peptide-methionine (S)-S-oxide reductase MsrA [Endozoicomonas sp.]